MAEISPGLLHKVRADWWLQTHLLRRRTERIVSWLKLLDAATFLSLGFVAVFLLSGLVSEAARLHAQVLLMTSQVTITVRELSFPALLALYAALGGQAFMPPFVVDPFALWHASQTESSWSRFLLRQAVWAQVAWAMGGLGITFLLLLLLRTLEVSIPLATGVALLSGSLLASSVPVWSAAVYSLGPSVVRVARLLRKPVVVAGGIAWNALFSGGSADAAGSVIVGAAFLLAVLPLGILSRFGVVEWDRPIAEAKRKQKAQGIRDPAERRLLLDPLTKGALSRWIGRAVYGRKMWGIAVRNIIAWSNESPYASWLAIAGCMLFPVGAWVACGIPEIRRKVAQVVGRLALGDQDAWVVAVVSTTLVGILIARLPRAGWRQEMRDPIRRVWPGGPLHYIAGAGLISGILCLLVLGGAAAAVIRSEADLGFAARFWVWGITLVPLWTLLAIHEPWLDTLPAPPGANVSALPAVGGSNMGIQASVAYASTPGLVIVLGLAWTGSIDVALALSAAASPVCVGVVWRLVCGAWSDRCPETPREAVQGG